MSQKPMTFGGHARAISTLGLPLVGGHLAQFAIGLTDTVMVGWYGVPELAALTLAGSYFFTIFLFGSGFAWAILPMVATHSARDEDTQIRRVTRMALWLSAFYFLLVLPLMWFSGDVLRALGQPDGVALDAQTYLRIAGWGMLPALWVTCLKSYLAGLEHTRAVLWITVAAAIANGFANFALIFGNWGAPELGIRGAAIASVMSVSVSLVLVMLYALRRLPQHRLFVRFWKADAEVARRVFVVGLPIGLTTLAEVTLFAGSTLLMGWLGEVTLAAHGVALQISSATFMVQLGLSNAATVRAGNAMGRGDVAHLRRGAEVVTVLSLIAALVSVAIMLAAPEFLIGLFVDPNDPAREAIIAAGWSLLLLAALFQLFDAMQVIHLGILRGLQDTRVPMVMAALAYWGVGMPVAFVLGFPAGLGGPGVWLGLVLGLTAASGLLGWRFWARILPGLRNGGAALAEGRSG